MDIDIPSQDAYILGNGTGGPIRPPNEAQSLLLRLTRNCPWNRCKFCPVYKDTEFSIRPVDHVIRDIDAVYRAVQELQQGREAGPSLPARQAAARGAKGGVRAPLEAGGSVLEQP